MKKEGYLAVFFLVFGLVFGVAHAEENMPQANDQSKRTEAASDVVAPKAKAPDNGSVVSAAGEDADEAMDEDYDDNWEDEDLNMSLNQEAKESVPQAPVDEAKPAKQ